ncbi:MAG: pentapeptide repeat-containing protein [bacterium]
MKKFIASIAYFTVCFLTATAYAGQSLDTAVSEDNALMQLKNLSDTAGLSDGETGRMPRLNAQPEQPQTVLPDKQTTLEDLFNEATIPGLATLKSEAEAAFPSQSKLIRFSEGPYVNGYWIELKDNDSVRYRTTLLQIPQASPQLNVEKYVKKGETWTIDKSIGIALSYGPQPTGLFAPTLPTPPSISTALDNGLAKVGKSWITQPEKNYTFARLSRRLPGAWFDMEPVWLCLSYIPNREYSDGIPQGKWKSLTSNNWQSAWDRFLTEHQGYNQKTIAEILTSNNGECADIPKADLKGAGLYHANLRGANLYEAILAEANLRQADLRGAILTGADLSGADLTDAKLDYAEMNRVRTDSRTKFPKGYTVR